MEIIPLGGGRSPPPFRMISLAPGPAQTTSMTDFRHNASEDTFNRRGSSFKAMASSEQTDQAALLAELANMSFLLASHGQRCTDIVAGSKSIACENVCAPCCRQAHQSAILRQISANTKNTEKACYFLEPRKQTLDSEEIITREGRKEESDGMMSQEG